MQGEWSSIFRVVWEIVAKEYRLRATNCRRLFTHFVVWRDKTHALGGATVYRAKAFLSR